MVITGSINWQGQIICICSFGDYLNPRWLVVRHKHHPSFSPYEVCMEGQCADFDELPADDE